MRTKLAMAFGLASVVILGGTRLSAAQSGSGAGGLVFQTETEPIYKLVAGPVAPAHIQRHGRTAVFEVQGDWAFAYLWDILAGDIDASVRLRSFFFTDSAELPLPDQVVSIGVDAGWTWRYTNGIGLRLRAAPGIYSDLEGVGMDVFYMPVSVVVGKAYEEVIFAFGGLELRPRFERVIMPILGMDWQLNETLKLRLGLPESRLTCQLLPVWSVYAAAQWQSLTFTIDDAGHWHREQMTIEDIRAYVGTKLAISDQLALTGDLGVVVDRHFEFDVSPDRKGRDLDVDGALFARFGLEGSF